MVPSGLTPTQFRELFGADFNPCTGPVHSLCPRGEPARRIPPVRSERWSNCVLAARATAAPAVKPAVTAAADVAGAHLPAFSAERRPRRRST